MTTLKDFGLQALPSGGTDPVTGEAPIGFCGWPKVVADFKRWHRDAPGLLDNAIEWRLEALQRGNFKGPPEGHDAQAAFVHAGLELAMAVKYGDTVSGAGGAGRA